MSDNLGRIAKPIAFRGGRLLRETRELPEETAVAISVEGSTHAVMMATPGDLEEFALGLALNEGIVEAPAEIERIEIETTTDGIDCRLWLIEARSRSYVACRRQMTGPVGCGLCGVESLELAARVLPQVKSATMFAPAAIVDAVGAMGRGQVLGHRTRAVHAAAFADQKGAVRIVREDVGRHNALDKVAGRLAMDGLDPGAGMLVLTSRVSVELIQKAAVMGVPLLAAVSVPTALATATADATGVTLVGIARGEEFEIFTHPERVEGARDAG